MKTKLLLMVLFALSLFSLIAYSEAFTVETKITMVAVNGATDTVNPGTSCIAVSTPISGACTGGYVAIKNNNKQLLAAALSAKATNNNVWIYYYDEGATAKFHCPGLVFTPCSVVSIAIR